MFSSFNLLRSTGLRMIAAVTLEECYNNCGSTAPKLETNFRNSSNLILTGRNKEVSDLQHEFNFIFNNKLKFDNPSINNSHLFQELNNLSRSYSNQNVSKTNVASNILFESSSMSTNEKTFNYDNFNKKSNSQRSTLSLHIAAYEASFSTDEKDKSAKTLSNQSCNHNKSQKHANHFFTDSTTIQNPFEFIRQQSDKIPVPEVSPFKASQRLLNPNQTSPTPPSTPGQWVSPLARYLRTPEQQIHNLRTQNGQLGKENTELKAEIEEKNLQFKKEIDEKDSIINRLLAEKAALQNENLAVKKQNAEYKAESQRKEKNTKQNEKRRLENEEKDQKSFEDYTSAGQRNIINNVWDGLVKRWGPETAKFIIDKLQHQKNDSEMHMLSPLETLHIIRKSNLTFNSFKIMVHELKLHGINYKFFATYYSVLQERKSIVQNYKTNIKKVKMRANANSDEVDVDVIYSETIKMDLQSRIDDTCAAKNYKKRFYKGREEIWWVLMADKGKELTKLIAVYGNTTKSINSPFNALYLLMFAGNDSQFNIEVAFKIISPLLKSITHLTVTENGIPRSVPVRFFFNGDYKIQKGAGGIRDGSCKNPCVKCIAPADSTYDKFDPNAAITLREVKIDKSVCQDFMPVFDFIPYSHYIPPPLHTTMHFAGYFFDLILDIAMSMDAKNAEFEAVAGALKENQLKTWRRKHENLNELKEELQLQQSYLSAFQTFERREESEYIEGCASPVCIAKILNINLPFEATEECDACNEMLHECCIYRKKCPVCSQKPPTMEQSLQKVEKEKQAAIAEVKKIEKSIEKEEKEVQKFLADNKLGPLAQKVEKVLQKYGGTKQAFFQAYTGGQLTKMAHNINEIANDLPEELSLDPNFQHIVKALKLFYHVKLLMMGDDLSDDRIRRIDEKMEEFVTHLKTNLPHIRVKQKGHYWIIHGPEFIHEFKFSSTFNDEIAELGHKIINIYDSRVKTRDSPTRLQYLMKCTREDNALFDRVNCKDF